LIVDNCGLHIWRCTADAEILRAFYETMNEVAGEFKAWRKVVVSRLEQRWKFVQASTFLVDGKDEDREYEKSDEGIIWSLAKRCPY
jgi:dipeptidyl-peptidase-3